MKTFLKVLAWITGGLVALLFIAAGGFWWFLYYTADKMCGNQIISNTEMQEMNLNIVVFQRDCGATTGFSTQVSIIEIGEELPNESGNIFSADTDHGKAPSGKGGGPEVKVEVIDEKQIKILHHQNDRVFNNQNKWQGVQIEYGNL
jgi:hypothetical protein